MSNRDYDWCVIEKGVDQLVETIAEYVERAISVEDLDGHLIAYSSHQDPTDRVRTQFLLTKVVSDEVRSWQNSHGISTAVTPVQIPANVELGMRGRVCLPLLVRGFRVGYMWVQERPDDRNGGAIVAKLPAIRELTDELAEYLLGGTTAESAFRREREDAFAQALAGNKAALEYVVGWEAFEDLEYYSIGIFHEREVTRGPRASSADRMHAYSLAALKATVGDDRVAFSAGHPTHATLLLKGNVVGDDLQDLHRRIARHMRENAGIDGGETSFGASTPGRELREMPTRYGEAVIATQAAAVDPHLHATNRTIEYANTGIYPALSRAEYAPTASIIYEKLSRYDWDESLRTMLEIMYERDGSVAEVAKALHQHRSSVYNKLERVRKLLGFDPMRGQTRLELHLALKMDRWAKRPRL